MRAFVRAFAGAIGSAACGVGMAMGQSASITVNCTGPIVTAPFNPPPVTRTSTTTILGAQGYTFVFNPNVTITGFGSNRPLADVLDGLVTGGQRVLFGAVRNPGGTALTKLDTEIVGGTFGSTTVSFALNFEIVSGGFGQVTFSDIQRPFFVAASVDSGGLMINTWPPPAPVKSEWHFDGDLRSVKQTNLAPASGPARLRFLDDPAFAPLLGGEGNLENYPTTPTPTGVTQAQSVFGTTTSFGLPPIGGQVDTVYRTSPPRNLSDPFTSDKRRGIGLSLWPNTRDNWPEDRNGQWTMVWDLLIPSSSWNAARGQTDSINQCVPLVETSANNNSAADMFLRVAGSAPGAASVGQHVVYTGAVQTPTIQPDQWFRLAVVTDHYGKYQGRVFVNGAFVGTTGTDWIYNSCRSLDPHWGDPSATNPLGTLVPGTTWNEWGQFPNPWAQLPVTPPNTLVAYMQSTVSLFADLFGRGESVYVANMLLTDEAMSDAAVSAMGGPNARGIVYLRPTSCAADFDGVNGVSIDDIFVFLNAWFAGCTGQSGAPCNGRSADIDGVNGVAIDDIFIYLNLWFGGCP